MRYYSTAITQFQFGSRLPLMFKLDGHKTLILTFFTALVVCLFGGNAAFARRPIQAVWGVSYSARLGRDLDGDRLPETATIRQNGQTYQVDIQFSTGRPKFHLTAFMPQGNAGLTVQVADIDADGDEELAIVSATSVQPLEVWLNQGHAQFERIPLKSFNVRRQTGSAYRVARAIQPAPQGTLSIDPLPQAELAAGYCSITAGRQGSLRCEDRKPTLRFVFRSLPPRGPPITPLV
jgi:hypothetical protein